MVHEPTPLNNASLATICNNAEYKGGIACGHDFWERAKRMDYGDVVLCMRCHQYFAKIKSLPWVIKSQKSEAHAAMGIDFTFPASTNHMEGLWFVRVPVRIT